MTSNGSLFSKDIIDDLSQYNISGIQITLDGCREDHNKVRKSSKGQDSYNTIITNIKELLRNRIHVTLRINYTIRNIDKVLYIKDDFMDINDSMKSFLSINMQRIWQDKDSHPDSDFKDQMDNIVYGFRNAGFNIYYYVDDKITYSCYADKMNEALINYNGDVFKCTARDFKSENRYGYLNNNGEIVWNTKLLDDRKKVRFKNKSCFNCRIAPMCSGGCSQVVVENRNKDYCVYGYSEQKKDGIILDHFENAYML